MFLKLIIIYIYFGIQHSVHICFENDIRVLYQYLIKCKPTNPSKFEGETKAF